MNILHTYVKKNLKANSHRTLLMVFSIALATAMLFSALAIVTSVYESINQSLIKSYGNYHTVFEDVDDEFAGYLNHNMQVSKIMQVQKYGVEPLAENYSRNKHFINILGFNQAAFENLGIFLIEGRLPQNSNELIVSEDLLNEGKVQMLPGNEVSVTVGERFAEDGTQLNYKEAYQPKESFKENKDYQFKIVGIFQKPSFDYQSSSYSALTFYDEMRSLPLDCYLQYKDIQKTYEITHEQASFFENHYTSFSYNDELLKYNNVFSEDVIELPVILFVFAYILVFALMTIALIYISFADSYINREKHLAILKSIGATKLQIHVMILYEGFCLLGIAVLSGLLLGNCFVELLFMNINRLLYNISISAIQLKLENRWLLMVLSALVTIIISIFSMQITSRKIVNKNVASILDSNDEVIDGELPYLQLDNKKLSIEHLLTIKHIRQNKLMYRNIMLGIIMVLSIFISFQSMYGYLHHEKFLNLNEANYDVRVKIIDDKYPTQLITQLKQIDEGSKLIISEHLSVDVLASEFSEEYRNTLTENQIKICLITYSDEVLEDFVLDNNLLNRSQLYRLYDVKKPTAIMINQLYVDDSDKVYTLIEDTSISDLSYHEQLLFDNISLIQCEAALPGMQDDEIQLIISKKLFYDICEKVKLSEREFNIYYQSNRSYELTKKLNILPESSNVAYFDVLNEVARLREGKTIKKLIDVMFYGYIILVFLMGLTAVLNVISINFEYRRKEFSLYRMLGLQMKSIRRMILFEYLYYVFKILFWSLIISFLINVLIYNGYFKQIGFSFYIPKEAILISIVFTLLFGIILMLYASEKIRHTRLSKETKNEISML